MKKRPHTLFFFFILLWMTLVFLHTNIYYSETFLSSFIETLKGKVIGEEVTFIEQLSPWLFQLPFLSILVLSFLFVKKYVGKAETNYKNLVSLASITTLFSVLHTCFYWRLMTQEGYYLQVTDSIVLVPIWMVIITWLLVKEGRRFR